MSNELCHYGILGQKWGVRRYQNPDGTLTEIGKQRYGSEENYNSTLDPTGEKRKLWEDSIKRGNERVARGDTEAKALGRALVTSLGIMAGVELGRQILGESVLVQAMTRDVKDLDNITDLTNLAEKGIIALGTMGVGAQVFNAANAHRQVTDIRRAKAKAKYERQHIEHSQMNGDSLYHHGIKGQEWGVKNGPPYPIDDANHSKKEKKANWKQSIQDKFGLNLTAEQKRMIKIGAVAVGAMYMEYKYDAISNLGLAGQDLLSLDVDSAFNELVGNYISVGKGQDNPKMSYSLRNYLDNRKYRDSVDSKTGLYQTPNHDESQNFRAIVDDLKHVNPDFRQGDRDTGMNCGLCSMAYEMRRRGYDVVAGFGDSGVVTGDYRKFFDGGKMVLRHGNGVRDILRAAPAMSQSEAESVLRDFAREPGTRGIINLGWGGFNSGHAINYEVLKDGTVVLLCPQSNKVMYGQDAIKYLMRCNTVRSMRTDNIKINPKAMKKANIIM